MHRHVRVILPVRVHQQHVPERLVQAHLLVLIRLVPERQRDLVRRLVPVRKQVPVLQALIADRQAEVRQVAVPTVKVERQVAAQGKVQVGETIVVVPIIEITVLIETIVLPVVVAPVVAVLVPIVAVLAPVVVLPVAVVKILPAVAVVLPLAVVAVVRVLLEAAVALPGAMFLVDKQKDALLPEVREVIALKALPVLLKETAVQEDNLFLYYLYQSHYSSAEGELDSGFSPARLFRAAPVTWISGRILSASISLINPFLARRPAISL